MKRGCASLVGMSSGLLAMVIAASAFGRRPDLRAGFQSSAAGNAMQLVAEGERIFRFDTFGDEAFWGGELRMQELFERLTPRALLALGLKIDSGPLSPSV